MLLSDPAGKPPAAAVPYRSLSHQRTFAVVALGAALLLFLLRFAFFRYAFPPVNVDEASFFSPAYNLATEGRLASPVHRLFLPGAANFTYWMPPFYLVLLGLWLKLTTPTLLAAKCFSTLLILVSAWTVSKLTHHRTGKIWLSVLLLICPFVLITAAFVRMEALGILLIILSMLAVRRELRPHWKGLLAGLCLMTHPALLACAAALALTECRRGWKPFLLFSIATLIVISPYIWYILQQPDTFLAQMQLQFARKGKASITDLQVSYILQSVPLCALALIWLIRTRMDRDIRTFLVTGTVLTLVVVLKSNEFNYQVYTIPYVLGTLALFLERNGHSRKGLMVPAVMGCFFLVLLAAKVRKNGFQTDRPYRQMTAWLDGHPAWKGKTIYVGGNPDLAAHLIDRGADVQRDIPIASAQAKSYDHFTFVIEVLSLDEAVTDDGAKPWLKWPLHTTFTPTGANYRLHLYQR